MNTQDLKNQLALDLGDTTATLSVRDLVVRGDIETPRASARKPRPVPTFERALVDGADCALRRRCGSRSELLVLLATQGQAYVMDERAGRRHALTAGRLATFCSGAHDDTLTPPWSVDALQDSNTSAARGMFARSLLNPRFYRFFAASSPTTETAHRSLSMPPHTTGTTM